MKLCNKNILITGATSGIGLRLVEQLYKHNKIYVIARDKEKIHQLQASFSLVTAFIADLSDVESVNKVAAEILKEVETIDVFINNAAIQYTPQFIDSDFDYHSIAKEITTNFTAICCLTYLLLPILQQKHKTVILNINTALSIVPKRSSAIYCASKSALKTFSQSLRFQLAPTNIKVLQAFLPLVDTPMTTGRGSSKMSVEAVTNLIINGVERSVLDNYIGKAKLLRVINSLCPFIAKAIMRNS